MIPHLAPVPEGGLYEYPIARSERLDGQTFVKWWHHRWLASDLCLMGSFEVKGMARDLFDLAQTQSPMGTLPRDPTVVARLLRVEAKHFADLCRLDHSPLSGWQPCITDNGEVRLFHPVVLEQVQDALNRREAWLASKSAAAVREQRRRLVAALRQLGVDARVVADESLIERMDDWLVENWKSKRGAKAYHAVMVAAMESGWFGGRSLK
jgi:hypothetical protein